jgi:hypothetical protein
MSYSLDLLWVAHTALLGGKSVYYSSSATLQTQVLGDFLATGQAAGGGYRTMGRPPAGTMHGSNGSNESNGANGIRWRPMDIDRIRVNGKKAPGIGEVRWVVFGLLFLGRCPRLVWCRAVGAESDGFSPLCLAFCLPLVPGACPRAGANSRGHWQIGPPDNDHNDLNDLNDQAFYFPSDPQTPRPSDPEFAFP